jgi:uncharacterized protein YkwD
MTCKSNIFRTARVLLAAAALTIAGGGPPAATALASARCADAHLMPSPTNGPRIEAATLCLINQQRAYHGLRPLREDAALAEAAQGLSTAMVARDYFNHVSPTGQDPLQRVIASGYAANAAIRELGENIAAARGSLATPAATVRSWMDSPPHRAQILDPAFRDTGIGVVATLPTALGLGRSGATYAEDFATRR